MTNTARDHVAYRVLIDEFVALHTKAARNRKNTADALEQDPGTGAPELSFVLYERRAMLAAVNAHRRRRGLPPIDIASIMAAERRALGHNYATKSAIGCADIVYDLHPGAQQARPPAHQPGPATQKVAE